MAAADKSKMAATVSETSSYGKLAGVSAKLDVVRTSLAGLTYR